MFTLIANRNDFSPVPDVSDLFSEMITPSPHGVVENGLVSKYCLDVSILVWRDPLFRTLSFRGNKHVRKNLSIFWSFRHLLFAPICSRALMIAQISAVNMDAESGNLMEIMVSDVETVVQARELLSRHQSV